MILLTRGRHGEIRLAGSCGADRENERALLDGFEVQLLAEGLGADHLAMAYTDAGGEHARRAGHVASNEADDAANPLGVERLPLLHQDEQLVEDRLHGLRFGLRAADRELVTPSHDPG
jgi:hypothetical protein